MTAPKNYYYALLNTGRIRSMFLSGILLVSALSLKAQQSSTIEPILAMQNNHDTAIARATPEIRTSSEALMNSAAKFNAKAGPATINDYINQNIVFPPEARLIGAQGVAAANFEILADGSVGQIRITQSPDKIFDQSVIDLISNMPRWTPAYANGVAIDSVHGLKVNFRLQ